MRALSGHNSFDMTKHGARSNSHMARIRTIKPEYWTDRAVGECSPTARLLFIASWNFSDDHGGLDRSAKQLKAQAFPYDAIDCEPFIQELLEAGLFVEYTVSGKKYLHIKGFKRHQRVDHAQRARIPIYEDSENSQGLLQEHSENVHGMFVPEGNGMEGKGMEGKGMEGKAREHDGDWMQWKAIQAAYPQGTYPDSTWLIAQREFLKLLDAGETFEILLARVQEFSRQQTAVGSVGTQYVKSPAKFFEKGNWRGPFKLPVTKAEKRTTANADTLREFVSKP